MILIDSREQNNKHILRYFNKNKIEYRDGIARDYADYYSTNGDCCVERKKNLIEFAGNCGKGHAKFKREMEKLGEGEKMYILIEEEYKYKDLPKWKNPRAKTFRRLADGSIKKLRPMDGAGIKIICDQWLKKHNIEIVFCSKEDSPKKILELLGE